MGAKTKTFDCVEMKTRIQAQLMAEYERRKEEFASYLDFIDAKADESEFVQEMLRRFPRRE
jgi:hypothetical protein